MPRSYSDLARKVQDYIPPESIPDRAALEDAIADKFGSDWDDPEDTAQKVADEVEGERHDWQMSLDEVREAETRGGAAGSSSEEGGGFPVIRAVEDKTIVGRPENVTTWVHPKGYMMGRNNETGYQRKIRTKEQVDRDLDRTT